MTTTIITSNQVFSSNAKIKVSKSEYLENCFDIFAYEPVFNIIVKIGLINNKTKVVTPSHGYFYPHIYGKTMKNFAKNNGFTFNNN